MPPWGSYSDAHIYQLVVEAHERPHRPEDGLGHSLGLNDAIWEIITHAWGQDSRDRPIFDDVVLMWPKLQQLDAVEGAVSLPVIPAKRRT